jgi:hypothetical protein
VERDREAFVLDGPVHGVGERAEALSPALGLGLELEAVGANVDHTVDPDHPPCIVARAPAHAGDERVPPGQPRHLVSCLGRHLRLFRPRDDRSEGPVDIEEDGRRVGRLGQTGDEGLGLHRS